jgi:hypothetical protein
MCLRHMNSSTFVANINDLNAFRIEPHPDRHDVAATERKHAANTASPQKAGNQISGAIGRSFHDDSLLLSLY